MNLQKKEQGIVFKQEEIAADIYSMWIETTIAQSAKPGQFISVYTKNAAKLLPRPISICEIDQKNNRLRIVYRIAGEGTAEFMTYHAGTTISILGPLGNGYPINGAEDDKQNKILGQQPTNGKKKVFLFGGGIGIPPILELSKQLDDNRYQKQIVVGYRDELFLTEELTQNGMVYIATEDGSKGTKGNVMDAVKENALTADLIYACGPTPMLRAIKQYAEENQIPAWISMEERMACGVGACLGCVCKTKEMDEHSQVHNKRICKDGPVFLAQEVTL